MFDCQQKQDQKQSSPSPEKGILDRVADALDNTILGRIVRDFRERMPVERKQPVMPPDKEKWSAKDKAMLEEANKVIHEHASAPGPCPKK